MSSNKIFLEIVKVAFGVIAIIWLFYLQNEVSKKNEALAEKVKRVEVLEEKVKRVEDLENIILYQEQKLEEYKKLEKILKDLSAVPESAKPLVLSLCFTESSLNYNVKHRGRFDKTTTGICGIKPELWRDVIGDNNPNSLFSGYLVLKHLLDKHQNLFNAVASFKGAKTNFTTTKRVVELHKKIVEKFF